MTRIGILQPSYLPWLGYFEQLAHVDIFVFLDDVQYTIGDWRNRNRIKTRYGVAWLSVPVRHVSHKQLILETAIDYSRPWHGRHLNLLRQSYHGAPYFGPVMDLVTPRLKAKRPWLKDLAVDLVLELAGYMGIKTTTLCSSELGLREDDRNERLVELCRRLGATELYEGQAAKAYIDPARFEAAGIRVSCQNYRHPVYCQFFGEFVSHLSIGDCCSTTDPRRATSSCPGMRPTR